MKKNIAWSSIDRFVFLINLFLATVPDMFTPPLLNYTSAG